jgi:hypothetical protein
VNIASNYPFGIFKVFFQVRRLFGEKETTAMDDGQSMSPDGKIMYVILFITYHRYHSLTHLKTTAIEIQGIKIIKKNEIRRKEHSV